MEVYLTGRIWKEAPSSLGGIRGLSTCGEAEGQQIMPSTLSLIELRTQDALELNRARLGG
jgi:hypothetical protein